MALLAANPGPAPIVLERTASRPCSRRPFVASPQQASFLNALDGPDRHFLVEARAGSGKSTTCRKAAWKLHERRLRSVYACFNSQIAREFQVDLPWTCRAATLHSLGFGILREHSGDLAIDEDKSDRLAEALFPGPLQRPERRAAARLTGLCKNLLRNGTDPGELEQLAAEFAVDLPRQSRGEILAAVPEVLRLAREQTATVDFDDMIWLPVVLDLAGSGSPDFLFIDEAQDLNPCQHQLVSRLGAPGRVVVVGDRYQAIYAWRGADAHSLDHLSARLQADQSTLGTYPLTVTRRCPRRHVELARRLVPDLDHLPDALEGEVHEVEPKAFLAWCRPGDMVLCRTNAPLVSAAFRLIQSGVKALVRGRELGQGLNALLLRLRCRELGTLVRRIGDHRAAQALNYAQLRNPAPALQSLDDSCDCLLALCAGAASVDEVKGRIATLFSDRSEDNAVLLSTVHRAKGLERDRIVIIRPDLLPGPWATSPDSLGQEQNLAYVAITRARRELVFAGGVPALVASGC
jgi:DNA helicase-2/ATP-dependent DNA helicase PcrA